VPSTVKALQTDPPALTGRPRITTLRPTSPTARVPHMRQDLGKTAVRRRPAPRKINSGRSFPLVRFFMGTSSTGRPPDCPPVIGPLTEHRIKAEDPAPKRPTLPLLFIRAADGTGFHSGHVLTCEKMLSLHDSRMMLSPEEQQRVWDDPKAFWKPGDSVTDWQVRIFQQ
jgi:hypothetical protein